MEQKQGTLEISKEIAHYQTKNRWLRWDKNLRLKAKIEKGLDHRWKGLTTNQSGIAIILLLEKVIM